MDIDDPDGPLWPVIVATLAVCAIAVAGVWAFVAWVDGLIR